MARGLEETNIQTQFLLAILSFSIFPWKASKYFQWIQQREGIILYDLLLEFIPSKMSPTRFSPSFIARSFT